MRLRSINETCHLLGIGRTSVYKLINQGKLLTVRVGRRTLIKPGSIDTIVDGEAA